MLQMLQWWLKTKTWKTLIPVNNRFDHFVLSYSFQKNPQWQPWFSGNRHPAWSREIGEVLSVELLILANDRITSCISRFSWILVPQAPKAQTPTNLCHQFLMVHEVSITSFATQVRMVNWQRNGHFTFAKELKKLHRWKLHLCFKTADFLSLLRLKHFEASRKWFGDSYIHLVIFTERIARVELALR